MKMYLLSEHDIDRADDCAFIGEIDNWISDMKSSKVYELDQRDEKIKTLSEHLTAAQKQATFYERENVRLTKLVGHLTLIHEGEETNEE